MMYITKDNYLFNIHQLSDADSFFYVYDKTVAKKGADDVVSHLFDFAYNELPSKMQKLTIFCDSCDKQNKYNTVSRFLYYLVHACQPFIEIFIVFPGHSYLECDRKWFLLIKRQELSYLVSGHSKLDSLERNLNHSISRNVLQITLNLGLLFTKKCPFVSRPLRKLKIDIIYEKLFF